jgi:hypothetical protein
VKVRFVLGAAEDQKFVVERSMLMLGVRWLNGWYRRYACGGGKDRGHREQTRRRREGRKERKDILASSLETFRTNTETDRIVSTERKGHTAYTIALSTG